jgi:tryptophanyl-tRNA synthetase
MDDNVLEQIGRDYSSGKMLTGEVKKHLINIMTEIVVNHQTRRVINC